MLRQRTKLKRNCIDFRTGYEIHTFRGLVAHRCGFGFGDSPNLADPTRLLHKKSTPMFIHDPSELLPPGLLLGSVDNGSLSGRDRDGRGTRHILLLDNDLAGGGGLACSFRKAGWIVTRAEGVAEVVDLLGTSVFNIVVVDLRPDLLGYEAICRLRAAGVDRPLLFISARSTPEAFQRALALGANAVAALPIDDRTLKAWIDVLAERKEPAPTTELQVGPLDFDLRSGVVRVDGHPLLLNAAEYTTLELLAVRNGAPVRRESILLRLSGLVEALNERTVDEVINGIRQTLVPFGAHKVIVTVRRLGFALRARPRPDHGFVAISPTSPAGEIDYGAPSSCVV
jgi:two-component system, cell cycle response regulator CtrA